MTEVPTLEIPKRPEDMAAMWPASGRSEMKKKDGWYMSLRDVTIGPFPNRSEMGWYHGMLQDVLMGWNKKELFAGRVVEHEDSEFTKSYFVERWDSYDGPFQTKTEAKEHWYDLIKAYNHNVEELGKDLGDR